MWQLLLCNLCTARSALRYVVGAIALAIALASCSSTDAPLAIRMYNPNTNQTLHCTARGQSTEQSPVLANAVEACARQLEASGFVRDN